MEPKYHILLWLRTKADFGDVAGKGGAEATPRKLVLYAKSCLKSLPSFFFLPVDSENMTSKYAIYLWSCNGNSEGEREIIIILTCLVISSAKTRIGSHGFAVCFEYSPHSLSKMLRLGKTIL